jgi:coenzyme F420-reducing hydrogenase beta subunit
MLKLNDKKKITFDLNKFMQCGTCIASCPSKLIKSKLLINGLLDIIIDEKCNSCYRCLKNCPSNEIYKSSEINIVSKKFLFGYNKDEKIRRMSSSGGVARTLIVDGIKQGIVDGVYSLMKTDFYPFYEGEFYSKENIPEIEQLPNSVYHSVMLNDKAHKIQRCRNLMIIGTACQLKGLDKILKNDFEEVTKVCLFCKQQKTFESTKFLSKVLGEKIFLNKPFYITYRGSGWPGYVNLNKSQIPWDVAARMPFGKRLWSVPGCDICPNPFGENVDLTLMDPWLIEKSNKYGKTLIIVHTQRGLDILQKINTLEIESKDVKSIIAALDLKDIKRKQSLIPFFLGQECSVNVKIAGRLELLQRKVFKILLKTFPKMPLVFYKILSKIPDLRNLFLK